MKSFLFLIAFLCASNLSAQDHKVFIVVLENTGVSKASSQPFLKSLFASGAEVRNMHAIGHPSEPNYIAMVAGQTAGIKDDGVYNLSQKSVAELLDAKKLSWKTYIENFPGNCSMIAKSSDKLYVRKHNPFVSFKKVQADKNYCNAHVVEAKQFDKDFAADQVPAFSLYVPNMKNDGHDTSVATADSYMKKKFGPLLSNPKFMSPGMVFIVTFDEDDHKSNCKDGKSNCIYMSMNGLKIKPKTLWTKTNNHYGLLRTVEDYLGLGSLGQNDSKAIAIGDLK